MKRALMLFCAASSLALIIPGADAQVGMHQRVQRGDVTGVELALEGSLEVVRGQKLRWLATVYEVVGLADLRPAPGARVIVSTSLDPSEPAASLEADRNGRVAIEIDIPEDAPPQFGAVIEVAAPVGVVRRFELRVRTADHRALSLHTGPDAARVGEYLAVWGRVARAATGAPIEGQELSLELRDGEGPVGDPITLTSDAAGVYFHRFIVPPRVEGNLIVKASTRDPENRLSVRQSVRVRSDALPTLLVGVSPARVLLSSREWVDVDAIVRRPDGRPVEGARVEVLNQSRSRREELRDLRTDARGRVHFRWRAPRVRTGFHDYRVNIRVSRDGVGRGQGAGSVRVAAQDYATGTSVEGGVLTPLRGGRVFVRVVGIDGQPAGAGVPVRLSGSRLGSHAGVTDAAGMASFEVTLADAESGEERCGGPAAAAIVVEAGDGSRMARDERCLAIDPDASARVRVSPSLAPAGGELTLSVTRSSSARRAPVAITFLRRNGSRQSPFATAVIPSGRDELSFTLPADIRGQVVVRARPLIGSAEQEVRGGSTSFWATPGPSARVTATLDRQTEALSLSLSPAGGSGTSAVVIPMPIDQARRVAAASRQRTAGPLADARLLDSSVSELLAAAELARRTPLDLAAPAVLRGSDVIPVPAPEDAVSHGLLRDPWRASQRFVEGRLSLLFRAIEDHVDASVPGQIENVAVEENGRFTLSSQLLAGLSHSGADGLGGEPLTIDQLRRLDDAFTYDNIARRITRERLYRLLLALRQLVHTNGLDLAWARPGEPPLWLRRLPGHHVAGLGNVQARHLVDGWGRPFELRERSRPRFDRLVPVAGYELVSAGVDGRFGTRDDIVDPTERILPSSSLYGRAVGEDALVARLRGVELGRVTLEMAAEAYSTRVQAIAPPPDEPTPGNQQALWNLPSVIERDALALALRRPTRRPRAGGAGIERIMGASATRELDFDDEPRTWGVLIEAWNASGAGATAIASSVVGGDLLAEATLPRRVRVGEPLELPVHLTNAGSAPHTVTLLAEGEGGVALSTASSIELPAGEGRDVMVRVDASEPGIGRIRLHVRPDEGPALELGRRVRVDRGLHPIRRRATAFVRSGPWQVQLPVPDDAVSPVGRVVLLAPHALSDDPDFDDLRRDDPALVAWSETMAGRELEPSLRASLLRFGGSLGRQGGRRGSRPTLSLSLATALVAWSARADDPEAASQRSMLTRALRRSPNFADTDSSAGAIRMQAAVLAALATSGVDDGPGASASNRDAVQQILLRYLPLLRRALRSVPAESSLLARASAALLLANPEDGHGLAMLERASSELHELGDGAMVVPSEGRGDPLEALTATYALALAAHQAGNTSLSARLLRGAAQGAPVAARAGGEAAFWLLANAAYGTFGVGHAPDVTLEIDGRTVETTLSNGRAIVPVELAAGDEHEIRLEVEGEEGILARVEAVFGRPYADAPADDAPFTLSLDGVAGDYDSVSALELSVTAKERQVSPVVDVQLPAGVHAAEALLTTLSELATVRGAELREPGFLRLTLRPMAAEARIVLPLPLRWEARGDVHGFAIVAYPAGDPSSMSVLSPREMQIGDEAER